MYARLDVENENPRTTLLSGKYRMGLGVCVADAIICIDNAPSKIGYATLWGTTKLEMVLGVVPTNGKIKLVGINQNKVVDKDVSEVVVIFNKNTSEANDSVVIGKASKCDDGTIDIEMYGTPFPSSSISTSEIIIR